MDDATHPTTDILPGIRWDEETIEREAGYLPEDLREDFKYLKCYVRDECLKDVTTFVDRIKRHGVYLDKTSWTKILRGRWNRDARGEPTVNPVIKAEKLKTYIEALRSSTRLEAMRGRVPFVETSTWHSISDYIDLRAAKETVNRFGIVIGHTGTQKTACFKEYQRRHNHGSTWWLEAPAGGQIGTFLGRLCQCSGISDQISNARKTAHLLRVVQKSKVLIIDNAQDLYRPGKQDLYAFNFLRQLQDETECCIILSITPLFEKELVSGIVSAYFEQFVGRSGGIRKWLKLAPYAPDEDVQAIAEAFGMRDARRNLKTLLKVSQQPGRIRAFFDDLQDAKRLASSRKEALTIDHLNEIIGED